MRTLSLLAAMAVSVLLFSKSVTEAQSETGLTPISIDVVGSLEPFKTTEVSTAEMGVVKELFVKRGERVTAGQPVSQLDDRQQAVTHQEAQADFLAAGQLDTIKHEIQFSKRRVEITKSLVEQGKGSPRELERYELELEIAKSKLSAMEEAKTIAGIRADKAKLLLESRVIVAPHDGIVDEIYRSEGEFIAANSPSIIRLVDTQKLRASFMLPEAIAAQVRNGARIQIRLPNGNVVPGELEFIGAVASVDGRTIAMTAIVDNADESIRSAHCELVID